MPFYLCDPQNKLRNVQVSTLARALYKHWKEIENSRLGEIWHVSVESILSHYQDSSEPQSTPCSFLIDVWPGEQTGVHDRKDMCKLKEIYGITEDDDSDDTGSKTWTVLLITLQRLKFDSVTRSPAHDTNPIVGVSNEYEQKESDEVKEFLYLISNKIGDNWKWGGFGCVSGALLNADARKHFAKLL